MLIRVKRDNVERQVNELSVNQFLDDGWEVVEEKKKEVTSNSNPTNDEIIEILKEKEVEFDPKAKKDELAALL